MGAEPGNRTSLAIAGHLSTQRPEFLPAQTLVDLTSAVRRSQHRHPHHTRSLYKGPILKDEYTNQYNAKYSQAFHRRVSQSRGITRNARVRGGQHSCGAKRPVWQDRGLKLNAAAQEEKDRGTLSPLATPGAGAALHVHGIANLQHSTNLAGQHP